MQNNWHKIWEKKQLDPTLNSTLEQLIAVDGFGSPFGGIKESAVFLEYVERMAAKLQISPDDAVFDVGCGAGAFLYSFYQQGNRVGGIDYSANLVKIALDVMPNAAISVGESINITPENKFDFVVSNSVFLYFSNYDYAAIVLQHMVQMASKTVGIFDVPDLSKKEEAINLRKAKLGDAEYEEMYRGLDHLYYSKDWFRQVLATEPVSVTIEDQNIQSYGNSQYRFNVLIHKN